MGSAGMAQSRKPVAVASGLRHGAHQICQISGATLRDTQIQLVARSHNGNLVSAHCPPVDWINTGDVRKLQRQ